LRTCCASGRAAPSCWRATCARGWYPARKRRRLDALPLEAVVVQVAALEAGELLALVRHLRPRVVPGEEPPAAAVAERLVQMSAEELRELERRLRERLVPASAEA
jgi:hypothetical protein